MRWLLLLILLNYIVYSSAQYDAMASSWSMWSAWSPCAPEGVMIRVRACSTVRGFKCVGRNKEFKSCELHASANGGTDFDQIDEDRQMAMKQLYQDYDLHADTATMPTKPPGIQYPSRQNSALPPGNNVVAPPGARTPTMPREETVFKGSFKSAEDENTAISTHAKNQNIWVNSREELMEDEEFNEPKTTAPPTTVVIPTTSQKRRYKAKYVTREPTTMLETTTKPITTTSDDDDDVEVEVTSEEEENTEQIEDEPQRVTPSQSQLEREDEQPTLVELQKTTTEIEPTETTTTTTTAAVTLTTEEPTTETTVTSFSISQDPVEERPVERQRLEIPKNRMKIHGRTMIQQLPKITGINSQNPPLGMLPPISPPRALVDYSHSREIDNDIALKEGRRRLRKLRNRKRKPVSYPQEQLVTGDTALALNWLIANMTQSTGDENLPMSDQILLERFTPKKHTNVRWSQWSLWSECRCGLQRRKRICLPSSHELLQDGTKCPLPEFEERVCSSEPCL